MSWVFFLYTLDINPLIIFIASIFLLTSYGLLFYFVCVCVCSVSTPSYSLHAGKCKQFTGPSECDHFLILKPLFTKFY